MVCSSIVGVMRRFDPASKSRDPHAGISGSQPFPSRRIFSKHFAQVVCAGVAAVSSRSGRSKLASIAIAAARGAGCLFHPGAQYDFKGTRAATADIHFATAMRSSVGRPTAADSRGIIQWGFPPIVFRAGTGLPRRKSISDVRGYPQWSFRVALDL